VEINTTTATATASNFYAIWAEGDSNVTVNSGTFSDNGSSTARGPIATDTDTPETLVTVKGGTFNATNKVVNAAAPGSVKFEGGTCTKPVLEQYCADGYIPEDNGDNTYGVKVGSYVAQVGSTKYETLEEALAAAPSGATVKLLEDIDFSEVTTNRNAHDTDDEVKVDLKDLTLDMNGHTITTVNASVVFTGNGATIENGNFALKHVKADGTTYQAGSYGLCIDGYGVENGITLNDLTVEGGINIWDADVEINDVTATATASNFYAIWAEGNSNVTVNSGTFSDNGSTNARGPIATDTDTPETLVTVKGGTFNATKKIVNNAAPGSVQIAGGTFTMVVPEEYAAPGFVPSEQDSVTGLYTVVTDTSSPLNPLNVAANSIDDGNAF
ncbi:MAG: hypothetical protein IJ932_01040, partial [Ruminococcus sp.]|nr:hypothetical protein [Ruminococcus sp.]